MIALDSHELAWAAGFFDGEGCVVSYHDGPAKAIYVTMQISQTEPTTLYRFQRAVLGVGKVRGPYLRQGKTNHLPVWTWVANTFEDSQAAVALLWGYLSEPKRRQAYLKFKERTLYIPKWKRCVWAGHDVTLRKAGRKGKGGEQQYARFCRTCINEANRRVTW